MKALILFSVTLLILLSGCGSHVARTTDKGLFNIKLSSKGELLVYGRNELDMFVTDSKGTGIEGATIEITPWMPQMGHGSPWPPTVIETGKGHYRAVIPLIMMGHWELKFRIRKGDVEDITVFDFPNVTNSRATN